MINNSMLNGVFSFIIPGLGQFFNGENKKALIFFTIFLIMNFSTYFILNNLLGHFISILYGLYAGYDAYINHF